MERIARLERVVEQILGIPVPQILKDSGIMPQHAPAERVQVPAEEQIADGVQAVPQRSTWRPNMSRFRPLSSSTRWSRCPWRRHDRHFRFRRYGRPWKPRGRRIVEAPVIWQTNQATKHAVIPSGSDCVEYGGSPAGAVRRENGGRAYDRAGAPEVVETAPQERIWCIFEEFGDVPNQSADGPQPSLRGGPDADYDATSLPQPDGVAGALAWLTSRSCDTRATDVACAGRMKRRRDGEGLLSKTLKGSFSSHVGVREQQVPPRRKDTTSDASHTTHGRRQLW